MLSQGPTLEEFDLDPIRGFLPPEDPLRELPAGYEPWEEASAAMPGVLLAGRPRTRLDRLPLLETDALRTQPELWRAFLLVSVLANACILGEQPQAAVLPRQLAVPLDGLARRLGVAPVFNYAAIVLRNWYRVTPQDPVELGNIVPLCSFLGGVDEGWFLMSMTAVEAAGARAPGALLGIVDAVAADEPKAVEQGLNTLAGCLTGMTATLARLSDGCDPHIFYHRIRPILDAWQEPGVIYEGVAEQPQMWTAASAAECALVQALDAGFAVRHPGHGGDFLRSMRPYMPPGHRRFVEYLEAAPSLREYAERSGSQSLRQSYNDGIHLLSNFRRRHMEISVRYVAKQARAEGPVYGTSGTNFVHLLQEVRQDTKGSDIESTPAN